MKKLNELVELAKKATPGKWWIDSHGHTMVAFSGEAGDVEVVFATDNDMGPLVRHEDTGNLSHWRNDNDATFIASANPATILAIAEAFRALEQEVQKNLESALAWQQRAEAAEAENKRLARNYQSVIDQHMPRTGDGCDEGWSRVIEAHELQDKLKAVEERLEQVREQRDSELLRNSELESKLAELEKQDPAGKFAFEPLAELVPRVIPKAVYEVIYQECGGFVESNANAQTIWTVCRAAILRNIEEAK